jgi:hypothetical protein
LLRLRIRKNDRGAVEERTRNSVGEGARRSVIFLERLDRVTVLAQRGNS